MLNAPNGKGTFLWSGPLFTAPACWWGTMDSARSDRLSSGQFRIKYLLCVHNTLQELIWWSSCVWVSLSVMLLGVEFSGWMSVNPRRIGSVVKCDGRAWAAAAAAESGRNCSGSFREWEIRCCVACSVDVLWGRQLMIPVASGKLNGLCSRGYGRFRCTERHQLCRENASDIKGARQSPTPDEQPTINDASTVPSQSTVNRLAFQWRIIPVHRLWWENHFWPTQSMFDSL